MEQLPADVRAFLDQHIFSASQLEVLLVLHAEPGRPFTAAAVSHEARLPERALEPWLEAFASRGVLGRDGEAFCFAPQEDAVRRTVDHVADVYARRRTTVSRYLYSRGQDPLTRFADAFRLRRDPGPSQEGS